MLRSLLLLVVSLFFCEVYSQEIKEDKHLIHTKKVISFSIHALTSIPADPSVACSSFISNFANKYSLMIF